MNAFIENLDRPGGHMLVCIFVMCFGAAIAYSGVMDLGRDLVLGSAAVIFAAMKGNGKPQLPPNTMLTDTKVKETTITKSEVPVSNEPA